MVLAGAGEHVEARNWSIPCDNPESFQKACGSSTCGRAVWDGVVSEEEVAALVSLAQRGMALGGAAGGPTILDLHSGALSKGARFIDVYREAAGRGAAVFTEQDFATYRAVKDKVRAVAARAFGAELFLAKPTFFSAITSKAAVTAHDEYWHPHVDKITYGSFDVTCLLYLTTLGQDFHGGAFVFTNNASSVREVVQPRTGRLSCFTSAAENIHHVDKVLSGKRLALTIAFTCSRQHAIPDPSPSRATTPAARPDGL